MSDYVKKTRDELILICKEKNIKGYSGKKKDDIIKMLEEMSINNNDNIETTHIDPSKLNMIDLFAGTGAFSLAFEETRAVNVVFANDMVEQSQKIYKENFKHKFTLANLNDIKVEDIPKHDILTGGFSCFVAGTKVLTNNGYKNIEDVDLTDKLLTHTGKYQSILNKQIKSGVSKVQKIRIQYHPYTINTTEEHPFYVREKGRKWDNTNRSYTYFFSEPKWVNAKDLNKHHYVGMPINTESIIPKFIFNKSLNKTTDIVTEIILNDKDQWFMMGYFLGDGWIEETKKANGKCANKIRFSIADTDVSTALPILQCILPLTAKQNRTGKCELYGCANQEWFSILKHFGKYAHGKCIPEWVHSAPVDLIQSFLDGYTNSDGSICSSSRNIKDHHISYTTVSYNIAFGIQRLYYKVGKLCSIDYTIRPPKCIIEGREVNQMNTYRMRVVIDRQKNPSSLFEEGYVWNKIKSVVPENIDEQDVYNFEVENDNSYCVENQIVHNCQPFSIAGYQKGFEDERSNVFWKILKIIDHHQPRCVILENVKNLVSHDEGKTFTTIKTNLESRGYHIRYKVLNTSDITGVPQHRERIYIVCLKSKAIFDKFNLDFPTIEKKKVVEIFENNIPEKYYYTDKSGAWPLLKEGVVKKETIYQYRRVYVRENKSSECPTLTANMGEGGHNVPIILDDKGIRKLTPRECFNFQGFPSSYKFPVLSDSSLYKLAGNAVSVPVVRLIANKIIPLLMSEKI